MSAPAAYAIRVRHLTRAYRATGGARADGAAARTVRANDDVSFDVRWGEVFGLLGRNGAGKTTLVMQILGLLRPTSGTVEVDGIDVERAPLRAKQRLGYLPQKATAMQGLEVTRALGLTGLLRGQSRGDARRQTRELVDELGLERVAARRVGLLSGGQVRLVQLAMAMMGRPRVLVLDEPTNDLDPERRQLVWRTIRRLNREERVTCLLVTHNVHEAEAVIDRLAVLRDGRLAALGTPGRFKEAVDRRVTLDLRWRTPAPPADAATARLFALGEREDVRPGHQRLKLAADDVAEATRQLVEDVGLAALDDFKLAPPSLEEAYLHAAERGLGELAADPDPAPPVSPDAPEHAAPGDDVGLRRVLRETAYLAWEQLLQFRATWPYYLFVGTVMPFAMVFGLTRIGSGLTDRTSVLYIVSGSIVFGLMQDGIAQMAMRVSTQRAEGTLLHYASLPIRKVSYVFALTVVQAMLSLGGSVVALLAVRPLYAIELSLSPLLLVVFPLCSMTMAAVGAALGTTLRTPETVAVVVQIVVLGLLLASPIFIPGEALPAPLRILSLGLPPVHAAATLRAILAGEPAAAYAPSLAVLVGLCAGSFGVVARWLPWRAA